MAGSKGRGGGGNMTGAEFKAALARQGISQRAFAFAFGLNPGTINRWCQGKNPVPVWAERWLGRHVGIPEPVNPA